MTDKNKSEASGKRGETGPGSTRGSGRGQHRRSRLTGALALLAFLIAVSLVAGAAWYWEQTEERLASLEALERDLEAKAGQLSDMEARLPASGQSARPQRALERGFAVAGLRSG
jgi:hypothetical protein